MSSPDREALARALAALALDVELSTDGALAVLKAAPGTPLPDSAARAAVLRAARGAGFTNVGFEIADRAGGGSPHAGA